MTQRSSVKVHLTHHISKVVTVHLVPPTFTVREIYHMLDAVDSEHCVIWRTGDRHMLLDDEQIGEVGPQTVHLTWARTERWRGPSWG